MAKKGNSEISTFGVSVAIKVVCKIIIVKGIDLKARKRNLDSELLMQLKSITSTETGSRLVLDALLVPLCSTLDLQFEVDKNVCVSRYLLRSIPISSETSHISSTDTSICLDVS
jgi:hypothetical protein